MTKTVAKDGGHNKNDDDKEGKNSDDEDEDYGRDNSNKGADNFEK